VNKDGAHGVINLHRREYKDASNKMEAPTTSRVPIHGEEKYDLISENTLVAKWRSTKRHMVFLFEMMWK
jgi:hypothetical protein